MSSKGIIRKFEMKSVKILFSFCKHFLNISKLICEYSIKFVEVFSNYSNYSTIFFFSKFD